MFVIFKDYGCYFKIIEGQFAPFLQEGGKLPSFSVCLKKLTDEDVAGLKLTNHLGDYSFYEEPGNCFWISFCGSYLKLGKTFDSAEVYLSDKVQSDGNYEATYLLMQAYMYRLICTGNFMIHSAAVNYRGNGILFCGLSGAGKSTQANLWKQFLHCSILNYDKPCVINDNGTVYAHGSPWSGKEKLYKNEYVNLKAIVYVVQAKKNSVRKLGPAEAMSHIYLHNYVYPLTEEIESLYISAINSVAERIPVYELSCEISEEAVEVLYNELFDNTYQQAKRELKELKMKYKVKDHFIMKRIVDEFIVIPRGSEALNLNCSVVFNEAGAFLWDQLKEFKDEETLAAALQAHYNIDAELAKEDTKAFLEKMNANGLTDTTEE